MSIVIVGGNERMENDYRKICRKHQLKAKVFTKVKGSIRDQIGEPELIVIFTDTVAHKMSMVAKKEAKHKDIPVTYVHSSSATALEQTLAVY